MADPLFELGQRCDAFLRSEREAADPDQLAQAEAGYGKILEEAGKRWECRDQYLLSKTALGLMICHILQRRINDARDIFKLGLEDVASGKLLGMGMWGIEEEKLSKRDVLISGMVGACMFASADDPPKRAEEVSDWLSRVCKRALPAMPDVFEAAVNLWGAALGVIFKDAQIPEQCFEQIRSLRQRYGKNFECSFDIRFPALDVWERPADTITVFSNGSVEEYRVDRRSLLNPENMAACRIERRPWWRIW